VLEVLAVSTSEQFSKTSRQRRPVHGPRCDAHLRHPCAQSRSFVYNMVNLTVDCVVKIAHEDVAVKVHSISDNDSIVMVGSGTRKSSPRNYLRRLHLWVTIQNLPRSLHGVLRRTPPQHDCSNLKLITVGRCPRKKDT